MDLVHAPFAYSLALAMSGHAYQFPQDKLILFFSYNTLVEQSREQLARQALDWGADYLIWFDSDVRFPKDTISKLIAHNKDVVGAQYPTRKNPIRPTAFSDDLTDTRVRTKEDSTGLQEISALGFGCVAIKAGVFDQLQEPWFMVPWSRDMQEHACGEDLFFFRKCRDNGIKIFLDHDLSKKLSHVGLHEFTYRDVNGD